jgi:subtilisin family serine protease
VPSLTRSAALSLALVWSLVVLAIPAGAAPSSEDAEPRRWIVRLAGDVGASEVRAKARALASAHPGFVVDHVYANVFDGFAGTIPDDDVARLRRDPRVLAVEEDRVLSVHRTAGKHATAGKGAVGTLATQSAPPWGLDRSDQRSLPLSGTYTYPTTASNVTAYIVDTGIRASHADFGGRVGAGFTSISDGRGTDDCDGHGTHVAGTVGGATYGMAKAVTLRPVRVLDCTGSGNTSGVVAGLDWIVGHHQAGQPAVVNMSLGGDVDSVLDAAVQRVIDDGVTMVVAAGNENQDACNVSPSRVPAALTVGATTRSDSRASFSNVGACLDLFAPGDGILSAGHLSNTATTTMAGTSMAAPHVAGAAALLLAAQPSLTPAQVHSRIVGNATTGVVAGRGTGSPDRLLWTDPGPNAPPDPPPATAPANDGFANAAAIAFPGPTTVSGTNVAATTESGEPAHAGVPGGRSVWWRFTADTTTTVTLDTGGSDFDTVLAVYTGSSVSGLTRIAANDDIRADLTSQVSFTAAAGTTYRIAVDGYAGVAGSITLRLSPGAPPAPVRPANDDFANATAFPVASTTTLTGSSVNATPEPGEPAHADVGYGSSVWWRFTAPSDGRVVLTTQGSDFDTVLAVYTGALGALREIAANDDDPDDFTLTSRVDVAVRSGTTYHVAVDGFDGDAGSIRLNVSWTPSGADTVAPTFPTGATVQASGATQSSVQLSWPPATDAVGVARYVVTPSGAPAVTVAHPSTATTVTGLAPGTRHTFSVTAVDVAGNTSAAITGTATTLAAEVAGSRTSRRLGGTSDVIAAAVGLSQGMFLDGSAQHVLIGRDDVFADSLAGAALAGTQGPILYTRGGPDQPLTGATREEVRRVLGPGGGCASGRTVFLLGGTNAVSQAVEDQLTADGYCVRRYAGASRVETSVAIATDVLVRTGAQQVLLARADSWADAATGGAYAAASGTPIVVTQTDALHPATDGFLQRARPSDIVVLGGGAAVSDAAADRARAHGPVRRVSGPSRDWTAAEIGRRLWTSVAPRPTGVVLVNGYTETGWAYALAAAVPAAREGAVQVYVQAEEVTPGTQQYLDEFAYRFVIAAGPPALTSDVVHRAVIAGAR